VAVAAAVRVEPGSPSSAPSELAASTTAAADTGSPEPTEPTVSGPSAGAKVSGDVALQRLRGGWRVLVAHVSQNPANRPLIEAARPVEVSDGVVVLGFPEDQAFLRDIAERKKRVLEEAVREVMGADYAVRCVATNLAAPDEEEDAAVDAFEIARRIFEGDIVDAKDVADVS
jgi:hypothetical protein